MLLLQVSERAQLMIHMVPDDHLRWTHYALASDHVADQIVIRQLERAREDLEQFVASDPGMAEWAQVRGHLFEAYVHQAITQGGTFHMRDLQTGDLVLACTAPMYLLLLLSMSWLGWWAHQNSFF